MSPATRRRLAILIGLVLAVGDRPAHADKPIPASDLAVDQVSIKGGPKLLGAILGREANGALAFAVRRDWLKKAHPKFFDSTLRDETAETRNALAELQRRIEDWRKERAPEGAFEFFLKKEAERVEKELKAIDAGTRDEGAPFMVVDVAPAKVDRVVGHPPQRRAVAQAAWRAGVADVESRSAASLAQELKKRNVAAVDDADELLDLLPPRRENDAAWAARKAIVEYQHRKPLDFQGTGGLLLKAGEKLQAANGAKLIQELIQSLAGGSLQDLLDPPAGKPARPATGSAPADGKWLATVSKTAAAEDVSGFRVTRVEQNIAASRVEVETRFVARLPDGSWRTVWQHVEKADASKPREDAEQQILQDPQVRAALDLVKSVGIGGEEQVKLAVRFGAATMEAQKSADSRFYQFRDRCLSRLDGPVLRVPPTK
ncbi:MAG: hypothetical protein HY290_15665 [Planctomycetia bacterium]|nr:hypothetical protein [Planctomycetia bacterium]